MGFHSPAHLNHVMMLRHLGGENPDITVFTNGPLPKDQALSEAVDAAKRLGIRFVMQKIVKYERVVTPEVGIVVCLEDGHRVHLGFLADKPPTVPVGEDMVVEGLGVEVAKDALGSFIKRSEPSGETSVPGCFVAGDAGAPLKQVTIAISDGVKAAGGVQGQLCAEEAEKVLAEFRTTNV